MALTRRIARLGLLCLLAFSWPAVRGDDAAPVALQQEASESEGDASSEELFGRSKDPMQDLLNWAVQHSDPEKMVELIQKYKDSNLTLKDVYGEDMLDALFVDEAGVMKEAILLLFDYRNPEVSDEDLEQGLENLRDLVEQVDNAANLQVLGGLAPLLELCTAVDARPASVRTAALWTLGVAVQNNAPVQSALESLGAAEHLVASLPRCGHPGIRAGEALEGGDFCSKLLFTISALARNSDAMQLQLEALGLFDWLVDVGIEHSSNSVVKKAMALLDTVLAQNPNLRFLRGLPDRASFISAALLSRIQGSSDAGFDIDASEKSVQLVLRLLEVSPSLFGDDFSKEFSASLGRAMNRCLAAFPDPEVCEGLAGLGGDFMSATRPEEL